MEKKGLNPASLFLPPTGMGNTGLIPPSHFETRRPGAAPLPSAPHPVPPADTQPWEELKKELEKLKQENEALKILQDRRDGPRARALDYQSLDAPPSETRALEIIAHQMREIRKLELAVADAQEKEKALRLLSQELQIIKEERTQAEQAEERRQQEEERRRQSEEAAKRRRQEELQLLSDQHKMEMDTLRGQVSELEVELQEAQKQKVQEVTCLRQTLQSTNEKSENLEALLSQSCIELESQNSLVQQLRTYIGELVPDNRQAEKQKREIAELRSTIQTLEKEREALQTSMSLIQTRLSSLTHILTLQENDLCKKAGNHIDGQKTQMLLKRWREKVFSLMVQLKSEEINKESDEQKMQQRIYSLENSLQESNRQLVLHSHALQDRTAELEMEKLRSKSLQDELCATHITSTRLTSRAEEAEQTALKLKELIDDFVQVMEFQEKTFRGALQRLVTLGQRVSFATKRVDTVQGMVAQRMALVKLAQEERPKSSAIEDDIYPSYEDLKNEVQLLNEERDHLSTELKRSALILEEKVMETREKLEAEMAEYRDTISLLHQSIHETEGREKVLTMQVMELERKLHEACETAEQLKEQLQDQNGEYEKELQHKVREVEEKTTQQLAEMEKHLHETRREHTKAVVALRQTERQMQRERNRSQETMHTLEDATRVRQEQLTRQLRDAERDKNLMIATLRQEGLFATYQKNRTVAIQSLDTHTEKGQGPACASGTIGATGTKESLSNMLANLQSLGAALLKEDVYNEDEDEEPM
ncbi:coiled-coil alpha-helical rod protein 1 [Rana temporaria]|uniref:coiled-coil alpha-helical rod protein 1 n=1 Tax=Rana temporaria TaxID=8407 RepID=UPI001AADC1C6|nr:coiled-coil alpha-helical rod protein 1 [Rana temporaria]